jgi:uncharacterized membrane protein
MALIVILTLAGIVLGSASSAGWLAGGAIGALAAQIVLLLRRVKQIELVLEELRSQPAQETKQADIQNAPPTASPIPVAVPDTKTTPATASMPNAVTVREISVQPLEQVQASGADESPLAASTPAINPQQTISSPEPTSTPKPAPSRTAAKPAADSASPHVIDKFFDKITATINQFFTQGNPIVRIGMVVMFFGLGFLVKYAASNDLFPVELRLICVAAIALVLILLGWKTRAKADGYGLVLQGGGMAGLYLTVFAALKLYNLLPPSLAFALMLVLVLLGVLLAVLQNAQVLAVIATAGGFLSPILTSDGSGSHVALFSFYLVLNIGILAIAWFKTWRVLNWVGFVFTFVIASLWGVLEYRPEFYASTQPFLIAFFVMYLAVAVLFSLKQAPKLTGLVDGSLVFGLPIVAFGLQAALLEHTQYGLAISALILAVVYLGLACLLWWKFQASQRVLIESLLAVGVGFATLAIPLAFGAHWTSASWALEATGLIWVGLRQQRALPRLAGYLLYLAAVIALFGDRNIAAGATPIISGDFISLVLLAASAFASAWLLHRFKAVCKPIEKSLELVALMIGWIWWLLAGVNEIEVHAASRWVFVVLVLFLSLSCWALLELSRRQQWVALSYTGYWLLPLTSFWLLAKFLMAQFNDSGYHPLQNFGWLALIVFIAVQYRFLRLREGQARHHLLTGYHAATAWLMIALVAWEAHWWQQINQWHETSSMILWFVCLALPLVGLMRLTRVTRWPFGEPGYGYKNIVPAPLLLLLVFWFLAACGYSGASALPYISMLNPLDLAQFTAIIVLAYAMKYDLANLNAGTRELRYGVLGGAAFLWLNIVLLRSVHHFDGVAYTPVALWQSATTQMGLSILWTLSALLLMQLAGRWRERRLWLLGAGLLAVVVAKLFTQDLAGNGTLARIISFMVVGGLMLLIGYLSPMPAKNAAASAEENIKQKGE